MSLLLQQSEQPAVHHKQWQRLPALLLHLLPWLPVARGASAGWDHDRGAACQLAQLHKPDRHQGLLAGLPHGSKA